MTNLDAIAARLGSVSGKALASFPESVQTLLRKDLPELIEMARDLEASIEQINRLLGAVNKARAMQSLGKGGSK